MQTKLVYVLTCTPEATYIEQALISIWSARYHNPDAHIVLLLDDKTNELLVGKRAEVLEYVTEKVVVPFEDANATMMCRSRWIKTQVRQLVKGDFLFIDYFLWPGRRSAKYSFFSLTTSPLSSSRPTRLGIIIIPLMVSARSQAKPRVV